MNSCVLMAKIVRKPELRYTQDNQLAVSEMMVEFDNLIPNTPSHTLKVVGWGNQATEMEQKCSEGNQVILVGRLKMNTIERQEGFKEKRAELIVSQIHPLDSSGENNIVEMSTYKSSLEEPEVSESEQQQGFDSVSEPDNSDPTSPDENNLDNIPF
jgi:single-stranded DNA-binding protein